MTLSCQRPTVFIDTGFGHFCLWDKAGDGPDCQDDQEWFEYRTGRSLQWNFLTIHRHYLHTVLWNTFLDGSMEMSSRSKGLQNPGVDYYVSKDNNVISNRWAHIMSVFGHMTTLREVRVGTAVWLWLSAGTASTVGRWWTFLLRLLTSLGGVALLEFARGTSISLSWYSMSLCSPRLQVVMLVLVNCRIGQLTLLLLCHDVQCRWSWLMPMAMSGALRLSLVAVSL
mmetsp:Transcript_102300/g.330012  ORF Transcript_102300/g.330012 Transcript_102300/m.330012 type:complete len:226 (-) Transcript_102300:1221-1898(-)